VLRSMQALGILKGLP